VAEGLANDKAQQEQLFRFGSVRFRLSADECQEILQETLVELMQVQRAVARSDGLAFRIFYIRCVKHANRQRSEGIKCELDPETPDHPISHRIDQHVLVRQGFMRISRFCRDVLTAHYIDGLSLRETAERVERAYSGISKLVSRCLRRLKECLEP
jgi:RNA polymerase sigma factor (sigma-70 family)